jgi:hypothetical protein
LIYLIKRKGKNKIKINKLSPDIYEIEDFVTVSEQENILNFCKKLEEDQWWIVPSYDKTFKEGFFYGKQYNGDKPLVFKDIETRMNSLFDSDSYFSTLALQRYKKDESIEAHRDYWIYDLDYHMRYGICIYYNDDYEGGELDYPDLGITYKPKARSLVMHGGNITHQSLPVSNDALRYFSTSFVRGSKDNPVILNKKLFDGIEEHDGSEYK